MTLIETLLISIYAHITIIIITIFLLKLEKLQNKNNKLENRNKDLENTNKLIEYVNERRQYRRPPLEEIFKSINK
jgi:hypothetical protein